jgi:hypothetical protein
MNSLLEIALRNNLVFDALGVIGLGFIGIAAVRLSRNYRSWGGTMMAYGAIALIVARLYYVISPSLMTNDMLAAIGPIGITLTIALPPLLLTSGLAGIVWGLWGHERWMDEEIH